MTKHLIRLAGPLALLVAGCSQGDNKSNDDFGSFGTDETMGTSSTTLTTSGTSGETDGGTDGTTTTGGSSDPEEAMRMLVKAQCDWYFGCCDVGELDVLLGPFTTDAQDCENRVMDALAAGNMEPPVVGGPSDLLLYAIFSVNQGRADLDAGAVASCVEQLSSQACTEVPGETPEFCTPGDATGEDLCDPARLFVGTQGVGEDCVPTVPYECEPGLKCIPFGEVGVCAQPAQEGENCFEDDDCAIELLCDYQTGTCATPSPLDGPCGYSNPDAPLPGTESQRCEPGLSCNPETNKCVGPCSTGSPCATDVECPENHVCALGLCQLPLPADAPCEENGDCESNICDAGAEACAALKGLGTACTAHPECESGFCDPVALSCGTQKLPGQACPSGQSAECQDGTCQTMICVKIPDVGEPCDVANPCKTELVCSGGICVAPPLPNGSSCETDEQCISDLCYLTFCAAKGNNGEVCGDAANKPCNDAAYCKIEAGNTTGACEAYVSQGGTCDSPSECIGSCIVAWGQQMCDATPFPGEAWCDGM